MEENEESAEAAMVWGSSLSLKDAENTPRQHFSRPSRDDGKVWTQEKLSSE